MTFFSQKDRPYEEREKWELDRRFRLNASKGKTANAAKTAAVMA